MTTPPPTLAARLARLLAGEHEMEAESGCPDYEDLDQACGNAYRSNQLITTAEADARVEAAVEACAAFLETHEVGLDVSKGYVVSPRNELSGGTHPGEAYAAAIRSRGEPL